MRPCSASILDSPSWTVRRPASSGEGALRDSSRIQGHRLHRPQQTPPVFTVVLASSFGILQAHYTIQTALP